MKQPITLTKDDCKVIEFCLRKQILDEETTQLQVLRAYDRVFVNGDEQNVKFKEMNDIEAWILLTKRMSIYDDTEFKLWMIGVKCRKTNISNKYEYLYTKWEKTAPILEAAALMSEAATEK